MRRSSSTTSRCGASSASAAHCGFTPIRRSSGALPPRAVRPCDEPEHPVAVVAVDHGDQEAARRLVGARPEFRQRRPYPSALQPGELHREPFALRVHVEQALAAVVGAFLLHDIALVDELLEHTSERLLGYLEQREPEGQLGAWVAVDEL